MIDVPYYPDSYPLVFSSNDYYVPYMSAMLQSIMENSCNTKKYSFYILNKDISIENTEMLINQIKKYNNFTIDFINVKNIFDNYNLYVSRHLTIETYFRLIIPYAFSNYPKVIYLDADMICTADISEIFDFNIDNYLVAAIRDLPQISLYYCPSEIKYIRAMHTILPKLKNPDNYFNGGLIIFNTIFFKETFNIEQLFEYTSTNNFQFHDQDALNSLTDGKCLLLPYHWNFMEVTKPAFLPKYLLDEYNNANDNPKIIHFKPWDREYHIIHGELFWRYSANTPFIKYIIQRMKEKDFIYNDSFEKRILYNITNRKGIGLKFILLDCLKAWLFRKKK
jgi:lipopolysaccharide biosynthesis glycosyltransferase